MTPPRRPDAPVRRRGPRSDAAANRERLVAAADEVFARLGLAAQLEDVAEHAGLGVGTAYRHLGSREAALNAVMETRIAELLVAADHADGIADPWAALCWFLEELAGRIAHDRGLMAMVTGRGIGPDEVERLRTEVDPRIAALLERAKAAGELRADVELSDLPLFLACVDRVAEYTAAVAPDAWKRLLTVTLDGLRAHRPSATEMGAPALRADQVTAMGPPAPRRRAR